MPEVFFELLERKALVWQGVCQTPFYAGRQEHAIDDRAFSITDMGMQARGETGQLEPSNRHHFRLVLGDFTKTELSRWAILVDQRTGDPSMLTIKSELQAADLNVVCGSVTKSLSPRSEIAAKDVAVIELPGEIQLRLSLPNHRVSDRALSGPAFGYRTVETFAALPARAGTPLLAVLADGAVKDSQLDLNIQLAEAVLEAFRNPPGTQAFFEATCRAALRMLDLDRVMLLLLDHNADGWICRASEYRSESKKDGMSRRFSGSLLDAMTNARSPVVAECSRGNMELVSIADIERAVAAPIFGENETIIGAIYGDRDTAVRGATLPITDITAKMLAVLAGGVTSSLVVAREQALGHAMSQFFSPAVLSQLQQNKDLLRSRKASGVSILFCDVRGFSAITERIGHTSAIEWIHDIMTSLSECVLSNDGVLVDYIGDELMAMWGAPTEQPDHAIRACRAAVQMLKLVAPITDRWKNIVTDDFGLGIGISSGEASVGNTGSRQKFKYGPLGTTVNVASRTQGITKKLKIPAIITKSTADQVRGDYRLRRITKAAVVGIPGELELYQLFCEQDDEVQARLIEPYEHALCLFEDKKLHEAAVTLAKLVKEYPTDQPTTLLLSRVVELLSNQEAQFDSVWRLSSK